MARKRPVIDLDTYSALDAYAIALNEYYKSLRRAGFTETHAFWLLSDRESFPDWIIPNLPNRIDNIPYEDDDEDCPQHGSGRNRGQGDGRRAAGERQRVAGS